MIRAFQISDLDIIMQIWLNGNLDAHSFIDVNYWKGNLTLVSEMMPKAEIYVFEDMDGIAGFIGLSDHYIEGLFVSCNKQGQGIGQQLLDYAKQKKQKLSLSVYTKNEEALAFYKREGFSILSHHLNDETNEQEYLMGYNNKR